MFLTCSTVSVFLFIILRIYQGCAAEHLPVGGRKGTITSSAGVPSFYRFDHVCEFDTSDPHDIVL